MSNFSKRVKSFFSTIHFNRKKGTSSDAGVSVGSNGNGNGNGNHHININITNSIITIASDKIHTFQPKTHKHLIIDDVDSNRFIIKQYLHRLKIDSDEASNGKEALEKDLTQYDIIWIDLRMPIMDGFEFIIQAKKKLQEKLPLLIAVTGDVAESSISKCYDVGFDMIIMKPILSQDLYSTQFMKQYSNNV